jgi:glycosyltransferase involved in cell wall biosynthesis
VTTIVIPAHNESLVIGRLLGQLVPTGQVPSLDIIVVANGCTDNTAEIARSFGQYVRVICLPTASKYLAMLGGDRVATSFPRIYVDADVELGLADVLALEAELRKPGVLAAAPTRVLPLDGCPWPVRCYYDIWSRLPYVRHGLFARGVVAVNEAGHRRITSLPPLMADDLAASLSFSPAERRIAADARVIYHPPHRFADLLRRRVRAATGVAQIERSGQAPPSKERTRPADLMAILRDHPAAAPRLAVFGAVTIIARLAARRAIARGDYTTWLRDESSRRAAASVRPAADRAEAHGRQS